MHPTTHSQKQKIMSNWFSSTKRSIEIKLYKEIFTILQSKSPAALIIIF